MTLCGLMRVGSWRCITRRRLHVIVVIATSRVQFLITLWNLCCDAPVYNLVLLAFDWGYLYVVPMQSTACLVITLWGGVSFF
ncbi:hypothetical protein F5Y01DRAFT_253713 [Xylaria sp. FL0043]|nr:hypothetical protein F5Y01DRAFT_253713 [Xylaria sp. FL0043]